MQTAVPMDYRSLIDTRAGTVDRRIFSDAEIYRAEMERIFARCWNAGSSRSSAPITAGPTTSRASWSACRATRASITRRWSAINGG